MLVLYYSSQIRSRFARKVFQSVPTLGIPWCSNTESADRVSPVACDLLFIGPWLAKDLFWTCNVFWCAVPCVALVVMLVVNSMLTVGGQVGGQRPKIMLMWVLGNFIWMYSELLMDDAYLWPRVVTCLILVSAAALAFTGLVSESKTLEGETN